MAATRSARARKAAAEAGPLSTVTIDLGADQAFVYRIACADCTTSASSRATGRTERRPWSTYRPGTDNGYLAAMDRWTFHLQEKHPDAEAPCLAYLPAAQQRLQERREQ